HAAIPDLMDGWIFQQGYPLLRVERKGGKLVLTQQPFRYLPDPAAKERWRVPVQVRFASGGKSETHRLLLEDQGAALPLPAALDYVLINEGGHGFFRVQYPPDLLDVLLRRRAALSAIERFNLVNDAWALVLADRMDV